MDTVFVFVFVEFLVDLLAAPFQNGRRAPYCSLVSDQHSAGTSRPRRHLSHDTAVSCERISCNWPGCLLASSPMTVRSPCSRRAPLNSAVIFPELGAQKPLPRSTRTMSSGPPGPGLAQIPGSLVARSGCGENGECQAPTHNSLTQTVVSGA